MKNAFNGTATDQEMFEYEHEIGVHLDNPQYVELFEQTARWIKEKCGGKSFVDIGGGVGAYSLNMKRLGYEVTYIDASKQHIDYVKARGVADYYYHVDINEVVYTQDIAALIEVAEHIEDEHLIELFAHCIKTDWLHFSSTPHTSDIDDKIGHVNIKPTDQWIKIIELSGWSLAGRTELPNTWSLLFKRNKRNT